MDQNFEGDASGIVYSKNVIEFVTVANEFCSFLERVEEFSRKEFVLRLQKLFPLVYLKATLLPELEEMLDDATEKFVTEDDYNFLQSKLRRKIGAFDAYQEIFDPLMQYSEDPVVGSLSENCTDIYQDLKDFILAYRIGTVEVMNDALVECRTNFEQYWGQRLVNGLRAIHMAIYGEEDLDQEDKKPEQEEKSEEDNANSRDWILKNQFKNFQGE